MSKSRSSRIGVPLMAATVAIILLAVAVSCNRSGTDNSGGTVGTPAAPGKPTSLTNDAEAGTPVGGNRLTFGLGAETDGWSPFFNRFSGSSYIVGNAIYDPLYAYDKNGDPQPYLAESSTHNDTFTEWTLTLRKGVKFHNGENFDASVVKKNFEVGMKAGLVSAAFKPFDRVEGQAGQFEAKIFMKTPWSTFLHGLTAQVGYMQAPSLVADLATAKSDEAVRRPIGTGPFVFDGWIPDNSLKVKRNDSYWRKEHPVYLDSIEFKVLTDFQNRGNALESGSIDAMETGDAAQLIKFRDLAQRKQFQMYTDEGLDSQETFIALNTAVLPFSDPVARQALAYGINLDTLSQVSYQGESPPARGPFSPESPYYTETDYPRYDPVKAKALAEKYKATHGEALAFKAIVPPAPEYQAIAQSLTAQALELGVTVTIDAQETTALILNVLSGRYQASGFILFGAPSIDREYVFIASDANPVGETSLNFTRLKDDVLTKAMDDARKTDDKAKQIEYYKIVQRQMATNLNFIFLVHSRSAIVYGNTVHAFSTATLPDNKPAMQSITPFTYQVWVKR